jgi:hypothetical protein
LPNPVLPYQSQMSPYARRNGHPANRTYSGKMTAIVAVGLD